MQAQMIHPSSRDSPLNGKMFKVTSKGAHVEWKVLVQPSLQNTACHWAVLSRKALEYCHWKKQTKKKNWRSKLTLLVQSPSQFWLFETPAHQVSLSVTISWSLPKFMSHELVILSNHLILCHPLLLWSSIFPSIRVFSSSHQVAKVLKLQLQHQSFQTVFGVEFL